MKEQSLLRIRALLRNKNTIDSYTLLRALKFKSPSALITFTQSTQTHRLIITLGFQPIVFLQTALLANYSRSGHMNYAQQLFDEMPHRNLVGWTALITAYVKNQRPNKALACFRQMQLERVEPDLITLTVALSACADLGALDAGEWIHTYIRRRGLREDEEDLILTNALINMYCKCGDVSAARQLFQNAQQRDVTTWTSVIIGYALHGRAREALELFDEMKSSGCSPNSVTFVAVLTACSHAGLVEEAKMQWDDMTTRYLRTVKKPNMAHYGCMVDLFCRKGRLDEAYRFIDAMPVEANAVIWRTLLGACSVRGDVSIANHARKRLLELEQECSVSDGVSMSNAYVKAGMWEEKERTRRTMKERRAPGCSLIEIGSTVHEFVAGDKRWVSKMMDMQRVLGGMANCSKGIY